MPHPWAMVDSCFPTFTGEESPREQTRQIVEYMMLLTEALKYQLDNLDTNNWNTAALGAFQSDTTQNVEQQAATLGSGFVTIANELMDLMERVAALESLPGRIRENEEDIAALQKRIQEAEDKLSVQEEQIDHVLSEVDGLDQDLSRVMLNHKTDEEGNATLGREGKELHLVGKVYINGVLWE